VVWTTLQAGNYRLRAALSRWESRNTSGSRSHEIGSHPARSAGGIAASLPSSAGLTPEDSFDTGNGDVSTWMGGACRPAHVGSYLLQVSMPVIAVHQPRTLQYY